MRTREGLLALVQELEVDERELRKTAQHNRQAWERVLAGARDPIDYGALGFTIPITSTARTSIPGRRKTSSAL